MVKEIPLTRGKLAIVDDQDYAFLSQWKWHCSHYGYAIRFSKGKKVIWMHRLILDAPHDKEVDHINRNKLDNRRSNLRLATHAENNRNKVSKKRSASGVIGVGFHKVSGKWRAYIKIGYIHVEKLCISFEDAVAVRKNLEQEHFGEYATHT